jgi:hypothetical protein
MAGKPSPAPNYHLRQINQPDVAGIKKPRAGRPGLFLLIFGQAAGDGVGKACPPSHSTFGGGNRSLGLN